MKKPIPPKPQPDLRSTPLGIDLGTTRTAVAIVPPNDPARGWSGTPTVLSLDDGLMTPSAVLIEPDEEIVGRVAKNMGHRAADCAEVFKRRMLQDDWRFTPSTRSGADYSAEQLSRLVLQSVATQARQLTGLDHREAVVTVPAYFGEPERRRTASAASDAGLAVLDIINEPTAAIIAYLFQPGVGQLDADVLVFDLGGGTFDTVVVQARANSIRVVSIKGDLFLGGRDFDATLATHLSERFEQAHPTATRPTANPDRSAQLSREIEQARESLSTLQRTNIPVWGDSPDGPKSLNVALTRADSDEITSALVDQCIEIAWRAVTEASEQGVRPTHVLFVGGMTRTPTIRARVLSQLELEELQIGADPDLAVAKGAAIWAQKLLLQRELGRQFEIDGSTTDWSSPRFADALKSTAEWLGYSLAYLTRLLALRVRSVTSRGYALRVLKADTDITLLEYLIDAGSELPFVSRERTYSWSGSVTSWRLGIYEDLPGDSGNTDPLRARHVVDVTAPMTKAWPKGSSFKLTFSMGLDQILHVAGAHEGKDGPADPISVTVSMARPATPARAPSSADEGRRHRSC